MTPASQHVERVEHKSGKTRAIQSVLIIMLSLGVLMGCQSVSDPKLSGNPVSSGEFYDVVVHNYTVRYPQLHQEVQKSGDVDQYWAALPIDKARWRGEDEEGTIRDFASSVERSKQRWAEFFARGSRSERTIKIKSVTMTDATHGVVGWISITDWENETGRRSGRSSRQMLSHWEKIEGQWRVVASKLVRSY